MGDAADDAYRAAEHEQEEPSWVTCWACAGAGWTAEHASTCDGSCTQCPVQEQCSTCSGTGEVAM